MKNTYLKSVVIAIFSILFPSVVWAGTTLELSRDFGGDGGVPFVETFGPQGRIAEVTIRSGKYIDSIQVSYSYKNKKFTSRAYGGNGGNRKSFRLRNGEYITEMGGRSGKYVDSIYIKTNKNRSMTWGGNGGSRRFVFRGSHKVPIVGFWGRSGSLVDAIGVVKDTRRMVQPPKGNLATKGIADYTPPAQGGGADCGKCDSAPTRVFPRPPSGSFDTNFWKIQNDRLYKVIEKLAGNRNVLDGYLKKEESSCGHQLFCEIDTRSDLLTHVLDVK